MTSKSPSMRATVVWAIRDARKLSALEKSFLYTVESRGEMTASVERACEDMGLRRTSFYGVRAALRSKGLLLAGEVPGRPTRYRVNESGLRRWLADQSITEHEVDWAALERAAAGEATVRKADSAVRPLTPEEEQEVEPEAGPETHLEAGPETHLEARIEVDLEEEPKIGVEGRREVNIETVRVSEVKVDREGESKGGRQVGPPVTTAGPNSERDRPTTARSAPRDERERLDRLDAQFSSNLAKLVLNASHGGRPVLIDDVLQEWEPPTDGQGERTLTWAGEVLRAVSVYNVFARQDPKLWRDGHFHLEVNVDGQDIEVLATFNGLAGLVYLDAEFRSELQAKADAYLNGASESSRVAEESQR